MRPIRTPAPGRTLTALVATGALLAAACGGDDRAADTAGSPATAPATTLAPPTEATDDGTGTDDADDADPAADDPADDTPDDDTPDDAAADDAGPPADDPIDEATDDGTGTDDADDADDADPAADVPADEAPVTFEAPEILQVTAPLVGGGELDLATVADRPVLLWFWAPF